MVEKISEYYKKQGFVKLYVVVNKEPRRVAILYRPDKTSKTYSYAKYLYTSYYEIEIPEGYHVDHINNNKLDDRIENYQLLSKTDNIRKSHRQKEFITLICPVCGKEFQYRKRNLSCGHVNPCCSRKCGGIKSHWTQNKSNT